MEKLLERVKKENKITTSIVTNTYKDLFAKTKNKAHYSEEIYNKFLAPNLFKQYDKIIITDVDVVFLGDISEDFISFDTKEDFYLSGHAGIGKKSSWVEKYNKKYTKSFADEESKKLKTCGGYWIFNLEKMSKNLKKYSKDLQLMYNYFVFKDIPLFAKQNIILKEIAPFLTDKEFINIFRYEMKGLVEVSLNYKNLLLYDKIIEHNLAKIDNFNFK